MHFLQNQIAYGEGRIDKDISAVEINFISFLLFIFNVLEIDTGLIILGVTGQDYITFIKTYTEFKEIFRVTQS